MNFQSSAFQRAAKVLAGLAIAASISGCTRVNEGNFGVEKGFGGEYHSDIVKGGWAASVWDTVYEVYGRERMITIENVRPKDIENVMLQDLDLSITYVVNPDTALDFLRKRGDIVQPEDLGGLHVIGETYVRRDAQSVIGETIRKFASEQILNDKRAVEEAFKTDLQAELNTLYGNDVFAVREVKIANIIVSPSIEERIQSVALINAERVKAEATKKVLETREEIQLAEMQLLRRVAQNSGLTVDQVLEARRLDVLKELPAGAIQVTVPATSPPKP